MASISGSLVRKFVDATDDSLAVSNAGIVYGTVVTSDDKTYVLVDGASSTTSVVTATDVRNGDRVIVTIANHQATITSNLTNPSSGYIASETAEYIEEHYATYEYLEADLLTAVEACIETLSAGYITTEYLEAYYLDAETIAADYVKTETLESTYISAETIASKYAEIDLSNVGVESVGKLFADIGILDNVAIVNGFVTGVLNGVTINADVITTGTLSVDRLLVTGEDSIVYQINVSSSGLSETELSDEIYQKYLNGTDIVANSITAEQIATGTITADSGIIADAAISNAQIISLDAAKITSGYIDAARIEANSITADKLRVGSGGNLYPNYDTFEQVTNSTLYHDGVAGTSASAVITTDTAWYGSQCAKLVGSGDVYIYLGYSGNNYGCIPVIAGTHYRISCYVKASTTVLARIFAVGHTAKDTANYEHTEFNGYVGTEWTRIEGTYTASSSYPYISIRLGFVSDSDATVYFDALQIEIVTDTEKEASAFSPSSSTIIDGGTIITNSIRADKIDVTDLFAQAITATGSITGLSLYGTYIETTYGSIGGWTITPTDIYDATSSSLSAGIGKYGGRCAFWAGTTFDNAGNAPFRVGHDGSLTADQANITGTVNATSGSFTGSIYASGGTIGGWIITSEMIYNGLTLTGGQDSNSVGMCSANTDWAFWAGNGRFSVNHAGHLYATDADIAGTITATSGSFTGTIYANGGTIAGWQILNDCIFNGIAYTGEQDSDSTGMGKYGGGWAFWAGNGRFSVTQAGALYATSGQIANWIINSERMYDAIGYSTYSQSAGVNAYGSGMAFWAGGTDLTGNSAPFKVDHAGIFTATNAYITGEITATSLNVYNSIGLYNGVLYSGSKIALNLYSAYILGFGEGFTEVMFQTYAHMPYGAYVDEILSVGGSMSVSGSTTFSSSVTFANYTLNLMGDDCYIGDQNVAGCICVKGNNGTTGIAFIQYGSTSYSTITYDGSVFRFGAGLYCYDWSDNNRRPAASIGDDGRRVSALGGSSSAFYIYSQWGTEGGSFTRTDISVSSSDIRLKDNIKSCEIEALPLIRQIGMYQFDWNNRTENTHQDIGMVADYLELLDPRLAVGGGYDEDGCMCVKTIDTFYLLGYAVKAIQEIDTDIQIAESRIESLEQQLIDAQIRIAELENQLCA